MKQQRGETKMKEKKIISFHRHGGFYNDGNSNYWSEDSELDLVTGKLKVEREESFGGQLASNGNHSEKTEESEMEAVPFNKETEQKIYNALLPVIELTEKYPNLDTFRFFSQKHKWFITGRMRKAVKLALADGSNYYGVNCLKDIFVLTIKGVIITTHFEDSRNHSYFLVRVERI